MSWQVKLGSADSSRMPRAHILGMYVTLQTSKPTLTDTPPLVRAYLLSLLWPHQQLGTGIQIPKPLGDISLNPLLFYVKNHFSPSLFFSPFPHLFLLTGSDDLGKMHTFSLDVKAWY